VRLGLLQYQVRRYPGFQAWESAFDARMAEGADRGAELLVLPEYASLDANPAPLAGLAAERDESCLHHDAVLEVMRRAARQHGIWLLGGSLLFRRPNGTLTNHAPLIAPNGGVAFQEKHRPTPFEREQWQVREGEPPAVFETPWGRLGIAVCYDIEHPPLARAQIEAGAWLVLVPTATDTVAGFNRVRLAARACALSNQCYVAVATTVGDAPWLASLDSNHGHAAVFGPIDRGFPDDGVIARGAMDEPGWLCIDLDPAPLTEIRERGDVRNYRDYPASPPPCPIRTLCP
jgi:predicted amidohydrolase